MTFAGGEDRRFREVIDSAETGSSTRLFARLGDHSEYRLAEIAHLSVGEDRIIMQNRAAVIDPGNIVSGDYQHHAGCGLDCL